MRNIDISAPVVLLYGGLGSLGIMRSLGSLGVPIHCITNNRKDPALRSRYCSSVHIDPLDHSNPESLLALLQSFAGKFEQKPLLIAVTDELAILVAENYSLLEKSYLIGQAAGSVVDDLADKKKMFNIARKFGVPVPNMLIPESRDDLLKWASDIEFPVMLKAIMGNKLQKAKGKKMVIVPDLDTLLAEYDYLEDPDDPNLMVQELIPGDDDQVYIFNGYFDKQSNCLAAFTGRKIRQYPIHTGCASLGECCWVPEVAEITIDLMQKVHYSGILDIGYRKDPRDGKYKVLDINPRVGQAFRLFVADNGIDVIRAQYLCMTGQPIPQPVTPIEGRRWVIEDYDLESSMDYWREGSLGFFEWLRSFGKLREGAWFSWRDPLPFLLMFGSFLRKILRWIGKKLGFGRSGEPPRASSPT